MGFAPPRPTPDERIPMTAKSATKRMLPSRQIRTRWRRVMRLVSPPRSGRKRTRVVTAPRRAVICRWISMREPMSTWPNPADIVGRKPWMMYVVLRAYHATAIPPAYARARRASRIGHEVSRRTASPSSANAVEGRGRSANRMGNAGSARAAEGIRERMERASHESDSAFREPDAQDHEDLGRRQDEERVHDEEGEEWQGRDGRPPHRDGHADRCDARR